MRKKLFLGGLEVAYLLDKLTEHLYILENIFFRENEVPRSKTLLLHKKYTRR